MLEQAVKSVKLAASYTENVEFSAEDGSRSDPDFLCKVFGAVIEAGATTINVPDTVGYALPWEFGELIKKLKNEIGCENNHIKHLADFIEQSSRGIIKAS